MFKIFSKFPLNLRQIARHCATTSSKGNEENSVNHARLEQAIKKLYAEPASIPIVVGNQMIFTGDEQNLRMPHNHRCSVAKYYFATKNHMVLAIKNAIRVQETWSDIDPKERAKIFYKAADKLSSTEKSAELKSAVILSQSKTRMEAENDVHKILLMIRRFADDLVNLSELKVNNETDKVKCSYFLRPLDGFVAASGPLYMSWNASYLALSPLIMGNSVIWRPPPNYVLTSFIIFKAIMGAGVPRGAFQFLPSNFKLFLNTLVESKDLAGISFAGRVSTLQNLWHDISIQLPHYKCFPRLVGECDSKGYHFVHESADMDLVVDSTVLAAFRNSGQKSLSCGRLYVPASIWPELSCQLQCIVENLKIGDPTEENTYASAIMREDTYDDVIAHLTYAKSSKSAEILMGGNFTKTHGYFVEPTIVVINDPTDRMMIEEIMGPVLCVHVYDNNKLDDALETLQMTQKFGGSGSIFSTDNQATTMLLKKLRMTASNLYLNEQCCGLDYNRIPLSGNRLSGTNDKNGSAYHLLRFAAPQVLEEAVENEKLDSQHCSS